MKEFKMESETYLWNESSNWIKSLKNFQKVMGITTSFTSVSQSEDIKKGDHPRSRPIKLKILMLGDRGTKGKSGEISLMVTK